MPQPKHLTPLGHRIDFEALITVDSANPNGDPMKKGLPRTDSSGRGVISAVCIRRKLRNALAELGQPILFSPPEHPGDDLARRLSALPGNCDIPAEACRRWFDVRAFGQVVSSRGMHALGVKGAVSIQPAVSVCPVKVISTGITCCLPNNGKISMGFKSSVEHGLYILRGSIIPGVAAKNGLTCTDCELLREALLLIVAPRRVYRGSPPVLVGAPGEARRLPSGDCVQQRDSRAAQKPPCKLCRLRNNKR